MLVVNDWAEVLMALSAFCFLTGITLIIMSISNKSVRQEQLKLIPNHLSAFGNRPPPKSASETPETVQPDISGGEPVHDRPARMYLEGGDFWRPKQFLPDSVAPVGIRTLGCIGKEHLVPSRTITLDRSEDVRFESSSFLEDCRRRAEKLRESDKS
jgi:hypothetical protein